MPTWLARIARRREWNEPPSESRTSPSPYQLRSMTRALRRKQVERSLKPGGRRAGVHDQVPTVSRVSRQREVDAERRRDIGPAGIDVYERDPRRGEPTQQARDAAADHAGADDRDPVADQRGGVPQRVDCGLDRARQHGACRWNVLGHGGNRTGRHDIGGLVRVEAEDRATAELRRSLLHDAHVEVAVLDRPRKVPLLKRCPHGEVLGRRHPAPEDQRLGASADARPQRAHHHVTLPRPRERDRPDLTAARRAEPERVRVGPQARHADRCYFDRTRRLKLPCRYPPGGAFVARREICPTPGRSWLRRAGEHDAGAR